MPKIDFVSSTFSALADPTRRAILARLAAGEASVTELAEPFKMSMPAISKHLRVLERADLISRGRDAQFRPCRLKPESLRDAAAWFDEYRPLWEQDAEHPDQHLKSIEGEGERSKKHGSKKKDKKHGRHKGKK